MRVALVHIKHAVSGGTEVYLTNLSRYLVQAGHEVSIVCHQHATLPHPAIRFVRLRPFHCGGAWRAWAFAKAVERHIASESYDVVLGLGKTWSHDLVRLGGGCHQTFLDRIGAVARRGFPTAITTWLKDRAALSIEVRSVAPANCRLVIANSEMVKRDVCARHGLSPERVRVIHNGVNGERFHPRNRTATGAQLRQQCGFSREHQVMLFLGSGYARKGLDFILHALPAVLARRPTVRLLAVGYDSARSRYQALARDLGVDSAVVFLGGRSDTPACYGAADLYVLPSRYDPFANSTLEALASGLPVITSDANGGAEVITPEAGEVIAYADLARQLGDVMFAWSDPQRLAAARHPARLAAECHPLEDKMRLTVLALEELAARK